MRTRTRVAGLVAVAAAAAAMIPLAASPAAAVSEPEIVADGLNNPYKMSFGPGGTLLVAEAGLGDPDEDNCTEDSDDAPALCLGLTGSVTAVNTLTGVQTRVAEGLPSYAAAGSEGNGAIGPVDVAQSGADLYVVVGQGGPPELRDAFGDDGAGLATVMRVDPIGQSSVFADLGAYEGANDPDEGQPGAEGLDTNPFAIEVNPDGGFWAVDAGGNDVLAVDDEGTVSTVAVLPFEQTEAPPFLGLPPGTQIPYQPVPTSITNGEAGLLVTELTGFPFPVGASDVYSLDAEGDLTIEETGFSAVVDAAQGPDGSVYVLEFATQGLLQAEFSGEVPISRLTQIRTDGTRKVLLQDELFLANGVAVGPDGMVYVSNGSQLAGGGTVIKVDPTVARDPATAAACDPVEVPGAGFADVGGNVHREAIDCLAWWDIVRGTSEVAFTPQGRIRRDQVASIVARLVEAAGVDLPASPPDAFTDDDGNVHEDAINALAALGVIEGRSDTLFAPRSNVRRDQMASLLARAYEVVTGEPLAEGDDAFTDDDGNVHEDAINAVAAAGWVNGLDEDTFNPSGSATRAQVTSMAARMLSTLVEEGQATPPGS